MEAISGGRERGSSDDWVVRYENRFFQIEAQGYHYPPARSKVLVCEGRHGSITIEYRGRPQRMQEIPAPARPGVSEVKPAWPPGTEPGAKPRWVPPTEHPWREAVRREVQKRALNGAADAAIIDLASAAPSTLRPPGSAGLRSGQG
ncbi:MAG: hypothetical protein WB795_16935, partial [Candidatus Acidiferrales bacterium]